MRDLVRQKIVDALASPPPAFTRRDVRLPGVPGKAVAVIGMRRSGKTTFLWQMLADRLAGGTAREGLLYFNFEDERLAGMAAGDLQIVLEEYYRLHPEWRDRRRATFFFDEIQVVPGWEGFARRLLDTERVDLFLSGSSARLLSREVATSMRGRAMEALVHPFSFREYLRHQRAEPGHPVHRLAKADRSALDKHLTRYLTTGGFPEAQGVPARDRFELLRGYVDTALFRDVVERHAVSHPVALRWMVRQLLGSAAGLFSVQKFFDGLKSQGVPVAKDTLHAYLGHLEDAFLVRTLPVATDSERRRQVNPRKAYPVDPGLIPVFDRSGRTNIGHALETAVMLELERRGCETAYVRTPEGYEVDFLARPPEGGAQLIQVCADLADAATFEREVRALEAAARTHRRATRVLLTLAPEAMPAAVPAGIEVQSAAAWLLDPP
ncbi:MAG: ATP-binding protein [Verrucomicrobia bacterium]|nr:ATP-binding protein [Verrucomicrobiota bacterium]